MPVSAKKPRQSLQRLARRAGIKTRKACKWAAAAAQSLLAFPPPIHAMEQDMNRREMLVRTGAAAFTLGLAQFPLGWTAGADAPKRRILMFTRSQGFEHSVVKRGKNNELSLAETIVKDLGDKHGFEVTCTKDGREFLPETIAKYDGFLFETTGDLTKEGGDRQPPMPVEGKRAL